MKLFVKTIAVAGLLLSLALSGCAGKSNDSGSTEIIISAAASLKDSMGEIQTLYAEKKPEVKLTLNFGGSGTLQKQIEQGAPADLFISAGQSQVDALVEKNLMVKESVVNLLGNELVLVVGADNTVVNSIQDLNHESVAQIGIGTPESVPAGKYAKEAFTSLKLWDTFLSKFVMAKDVSQVLNYVETGNAEAGVVYQSDAQGSKKVKVIETFPEDSHKAITYPAGIVSATKKKESAEEFLAFLQSPEAQKIFKNYGFKTMTK